MESGHIRESARSRFESLMSPDACVIWDRLTSELVCSVDTQHVFLKEQIPSLRALYKAAACSVAASSPFPCSPSAGYISSPTFHYPWLLSTSLQFTALLLAALLLIQLRPSAGGS